MVFGATSPRSPFQDALEAEGCATRTIEINDSGFDEWVAGVAPDVAIFDRFMLEEQLGWRVEKAVPRAVRILDTIDLHFLRRARMRWCERNPGRVAPVWGAKDFWRQLGPELRHEETWREIAAILRSDHSWVVSDAEAELLKALNVSEEKFSLQRFVPSFSRKDFSKTPRSGFVTIGNFRHPPNWDSVLWLKKDIWPRIHAELRARGENPELHVYGSYPPKEAMDLSDPGSGFRVKGPAVDAIETVSKYSVCLCPLRYGAGVKGKILDSLAAGTCVITTSVGAEGMFGSEEFPGIVADTVEELVAASVDLYLNPEKQKDFSAKGLPFLELEDQMAKAVGDIVLTIDSIRARDWVGPILRSQTVRATEYFSRWIEAKSRSYR